MTEDWPYSGLRLIVAAQIAWGESVAKKLFPNPAPEVPLQAPLTVLAIEECARPSS
jgi:hypothetical protein